MCVHARAFEVVKFLSRESAHTHLALLAFFFLALWIFLTFSFVSSLASFWPIGFVPFFPLSIILLLQRNYHCTSCIQSNYTARWYTDTVRRRERDGETATLAVFKYSVQLFGRLGERPIDRHYHLPTTRTKTGDDGVHFSSFLDFSVFLSVRPFPCVFGLLVTFIYHFQSQGNYMTMLFYSSDPICFTFGSWIIQCDSGNGEMLPVLCCWSNEENDASS